LKIACQSCQAKYTIADEKVVGKIVKIRCKKCGATIVINGNDPEATNPLPAGEGGSEWTVNVAEGDQRTMTSEEIVDGYRGGVVTDDEIRSLAISQRLLGTEEIILIHHTDCGMLTFKDDEFKAAIQDETGIKPEWAAESFSDLDQDVRQSIARIKASPFIPRRDAVRGFVYEVETGRLREVV